MKLNTIEILQILCLKLFHKYMYFVKKKIASCQRVYMRGLLNPVAYGPEAAQRVWPTLQCPNHLQIGAVPTV